jgi:glycerol uptake facilitator protein
MNPAVTFALAVTRRFPWRQLPVYWAAQYAGAIIGALAIWAVFGQRAIDLGVGQTAFNESTTTYLAAAVAEAIGTGLLILAILGIVDSKAPGQLAGLVIGGAVVAIILVFGPITGASLNPARALGPELVAAVGSGTTHWAQYVPVYFVPGLVGAALAALAYDWINKPVDAEAPATVSSRPGATPAEAAAS